MKIIDARGTIPLVWLLSACSAQLDPLPPEEACNDVRYALAAKTIECTDDPALALKRDEDFRSRFQCKIDVNGVGYAYACSANVQAMSCVSLGLYGDDLDLLLGQVDQCSSTFSGSSIADTCVEIASYIERRIQQCGGTANNAKEASQIFFSNYQCKADVSGKALEECKTALSSCTTEWTYPVAMLDERCSEAVKILPIDGTPSGCCRFLRGGLVPKRCL